MTKKIFFKHFGYGRDNRYCPKHAITNQKDDITVMKVPPWNFHAYENSLLGPFSNSHALLAKTLHNSHLWANNKKNEVLCNVTCSQLFLVQNITLFMFCERFEPRSHFISWVSMIIWWTYTVVQYRTAVVDSDWRFNNPCGSHLQSRLVISCTITCILQPYNIHVADKLITTSQQLLTIN